MGDGDANLNEPATVVVAWRSGRNAHGRAVKAGGQVARDLRDYAIRAENIISTGQGRPYDPNDEQDEETKYLETDRNELLDTALLEQILKASSLDLVSSDDLRKRTMALYALVVGGDPDKLRAYIRKKNPVQVAKKGILALFDETLTRIEQPLFSFDEHFDVVIYPDCIRIIHQKHFEGLFRESEAVLAKTAEWAEELSKSLPIDAAGAEWMTMRLRETSVMRRRVQSILKSKYLSTLTIDSLRTKMVERGLDPDKLISGDSLVLNKETERDVLLFLNEDLWTGDFSGEQYAASRKARR